MKNDKFLLTLLDQLSNRPLMFFLSWGILVVFFLYLFWSLQKKRDRRYFKEDASTGMKKGSSVQLVEKEQQKK